MKLANESHRITHLTPIDHDQMDVELREAISTEYWRILPAMNAIYEYVIGFGSVYSDTISVRHLFEFAEDLTEYARNLDAQGRIYSDIVSRYRLSSDAFFESVLEDDADLTICSAELALLRGAFQFDMSDEDEDLPDLDAIQSDAFEPDNIDLLGPDRCPDFIALLKARIDTLLTETRDSITDTGNTGYAEELKGFGESDFDRIHMVSRHILPILVLEERPEEASTSLYTLMCITRQAEADMALGSYDVPFWLQVHKLRTALHSM